MNAAATLSMGIRALPTPSFICGQHDGDAGVDAVVAWRAMDGCLGGARVTGWRGAARHEGRTACESRVRRSVLGEGIDTSGWGEAVDQA
jgi:hypothetical protein